MVCSTLDPAEHIYIEVTRGIEGGFLCQAKLSSSAINYTKWSLWLESIDMMD